MAQDAGPRRNRHSLPATSARKAMWILDSDSQFMGVKYPRRPYAAHGEGLCIVLKIGRIPDTCVSSINIYKREVWLEGCEEVYRYRDDSMVLLLKKAMTRKATFIIKGRVIDWIDLKENAPTPTRAELLKEFEENCLSLVELSSDIIVTSNLRGILTSINEAGERISGYSKDEIVGKPFWKIGNIIPVKEIPKYIQMLISAARGRMPKPFEATWYRKDGTPCVSEIRACFLKNKGKRVGFQVIIRDITKRKRVEE